MRALSHFLRATVLGFFLVILIFQAATLSARDSQNVDEMTIDEIANSLSMTWRDNNTLTSQIFSKAEKEPEFRKNLINVLTKRFAAETIRIRCSNLTRSFVYLNASEILPELRKKWNETEKKTEALEFADLRIQLLIAIAKFLPEDESIEFLIKTESDTAEAPIVRFRATILLCATGNKKAIEYVLSVYEKAKQGFPITMAGNNILLNKTQNDSDGDLISDVNEIAILLDPKKPDTDGDGLIDGNDRNPFCKLQEEKLSEDQQIAQFILYLLARYYCRSLTNPSIFFSPFECKLLIVEITDDYDGTARPGLFENISFTGIDGVILHLSREQILKMRAIHEHLDEIRLHKYPEEEKNMKKFFLSEFNRFFRMTFKNYNGTWLPIDWELAGMS